MVKLKRPNSPKIKTTRVTTLGSLNQESTKYILPNTPLDPQKRTRNSRRSFDRFAALSRYSSYLSMLVTLRYHNQTVDGLGRVGSPAVPPPHRGSDLNSSMGELHSFPKWGDTSHPVHAALQSTLVWVTCELLWPASCPTFCPRPARRISRLQSRRRYFG